MSMIFSPRLPITAPIVGTDDLFPINRIYCVGRNYAAHAREMGRDPDREAPFFFLKDADAYAPDGARIPYPSETSDYHHEIELVVAIGERGFQVAQEDALSLVFGYAVGLDMTRRDLQLEARQTGRPWCTGKNFPLSAPMGPITVSQGQNFAAGAISVAVNGVVKQSSDVSKLIWNVPETIACLSRYYTLLPGDLIFTGTPEGVGPVVAGDILVGTIDGLEPVRVEILEPEGLQA